ncbi:MAG: extensin family protein [Myxococcales bacterium]|nr:extensin family protein [Myxococcales bacterium]
MRRRLPIALAWLFACGAPAGPTAGKRLAASEGDERAARASTEATLAAPEPDRGMGAPGLPALGPSDHVALDEAACLARVAELSLPVTQTPHDAVEGALVIEGPVGGVEWIFEGRREVHRVMDCRLVLALHAWAPALRAVGVRKVRHLSALRPAARVRSTGAPSGHARGLAVDPRFFERDDGTVLDVLEDWSWRERGAPPCDPPLDEPEASATLRQLVCAAIDADLFQVVVTPHHDDAHANHVHVEVVPGIDWRWAR